MTSVLAVTTRTVTAHTVLVPCPCDQGLLRVVFSVFLYCHRHLHTVAAPTPCLSAICHTLPVCYMPHLACLLYAKLAFRYQALVKCLPPPVNEPKIARQPSDCLSTMLLTAYLLDASRTLTSLSQLRCKLALAIFQLQFQHRLMR